ncbi:pilus assembly protein Flp/PilA [Alkalibacillus filiformis]|uniref:Pilus assembly protein Flp/PilA n=1 Tax=Alkalibacillus filiformis TaxID=200990 RepID=A0ABU0DSA1_9BACI|nr:Flp family type IVb pilin [Alkalibacillus filiformis]MDQ0351315.1 pilus assembly protein Flp/PilA [Alkalibacillus filiformis]
MKQFFKEFLLEEEGQGMAEYALVLGVIAVGVVAVLATFGEQIMGVFNEVIDNFGEAPGAEDVETE